ncbi:MAG: phage terminase large subunit family protein [Planctomycetes bacterium]|nr:phage terminase large subunit family protein [Planctomycetota bacterium]
MDRITLAEALIYLDGQPISFRARPYLRAVYASEAERLVLRASRQSEKSTTLAILVLLELLTSAHARVLVVFPRREQLRMFRETLLLAIVRDSPVVRDVLLGAGSHTKGYYLRFSNGSEVFLRPSFQNADTVRGITAVFLLVDETQDTAPDTLEVAEQNLSHALRKRIVVAGTPKLSDNLLEKCFAATTQNEWVSVCKACGHENVPELKCLGPDAIQCATCGQPICFAEGRWVARQPDARGGEGFWFNYLITPWLKLDELLYWRETYAPARFKNEVLGQPTIMGDHLVTREQVEACCGERPSIRERQKLSGVNLMLQSLVLGIDWSGGVNSRTAFVVGAHDAQGIFQVLHLESMPIADGFDDALARAKDLIIALGIDLVAADANGNGSVLNRLLLMNCQEAHRSLGLYGLMYADTESSPQFSRSMYRWTVDRTAWIGEVFTRIKKKKIRFPRLTDCGKCLEELWHETALYDNAARRHRFVCPSGGQDDVLHALTYALRLSSHAWGASWAAA